MTENSRIGDEKYPRGMSIRLWLANKNDRPYNLYRIVVCILPCMYNASVVAAGSIDIGITPTSGSLGKYIHYPLIPRKELKYCKTKYLGMSQVSPM